MHPEFAPIALLAALSLIFPLPWHWRARNVATLSIIGWFFVMNMIYAINAIIWAGNVDIAVPVWCDITTKLVIGANFALPAACLCICMHLEQVSSVRSSPFHIKDRRQRQRFECFMCLGLPIFFMALHYIVQGHRFDIIEDYGCWPTTYFSIPSIFIVWLFPILMSIGALTFASLSLRHFMMRRLTFAAHLSSGNSALTTSRYLRLMAMSALQIFWSLGITVYVLWLTILNLPFRPWTDWDDVHSDFLRIDQYPTAFTPPIILRAFNASWWLIPASTFLFVAFFSFGRDAVDEYKKCLLYFKIHILHVPEAIKNMKLPIGASSSKTETTLTISSPTLITSSNIGASFQVLGSSPSSPTSSIGTLKPTYDPSCYPSPLPFKAPKAVGSFADLSTPVTPSTAVPPYDEDTVIDIKRQLPSTLPAAAPTVAYPRIRGQTCRHEGLASPRPFTYPSNDASHQNLDQFDFSTEKV